jgi:hypothetical protein
VKTRLLLAASALGFVPLAAPAAAQHQHMPGITMPMPKPAARKLATKKETSKKVAKAKKIATAKKSATKMPLTAKKASAAHADHAHKPSGDVPMEPGMTMWEEQTGEQPSAEPMPMDHSQMGHSQTGQMNATMGEHADHGAMSGALGRYPATREASGTAWQPDTSEHMGLVSEAGDWMLMGHGVINLVYDHQSGRRGDDKAFASGMLMGMARRPLGNGTLQLKAMISPDPLMGKRGYPLLLASGETANGRERLIDRQHPHDFFMELSASVSQNFGPNSSVFLYAGLPGEPAFGPPAFMHREAIMDSPEAPISHHWLDSTHISFGVVTGGVTMNRVKLEVSRFNGREPDQQRWDIETGSLDSTAIRLSWNPTAELSLQGSWGNFKDPEQLEPGVGQKRWSASLLYEREVAPGWKFAGTLAWGRKTVERHDDDAYIVEASLKHRGWTLFGRGEMTENRELAEDVEEHGPAFRVGKVSLGVVHDFRVDDHLSLGTGVLFALNLVPDGLARLYGGHNPIGAMGFVRLKFD